MGKPEGSVKQTIWVDMDNTPHVPFFDPIIEQLRARGYTVVVTVRDAYQACELADFYKLDYQRVGKHYGRHRLMKIGGTLLRSLDLARVIRKYRPSLAVAHGSRSMIIASSLLGIPSLQIIDYEHIASAGSRPTWLMMPDVVTSSRYPRQHERMLTYPGLKEDVYVPRFTPDPSIRKQLGIADEELMVTVRPPATEAHYHAHQSDELFDAVIEFLAGKPGVRSVLLPRNHRQEVAIRNQWPELIKAGKVIIPDQVVNGLNLLWFSDLAISGGGTMNREAAALGVPVYSIFRGTIGDVDRYLSESGRLVLIEKVEDITSKIHLRRWERPESPPRGPNATLRTIVDNIVSILQGRQEELPAKNPTMQAFLDHTKCPPSFVEGITGSNLSGDAGFFRADGLRLYGRISSGSTSRQYTENPIRVAPSVSQEKGSMELPFNPSEVIDNLRRERYVRGIEGGGHLSDNKALRGVYYASRPLFPVPVRRVLQRTALRDWAKIPFPAWPLDTTVEDLINFLWTQVFQVAGEREIPFIWFWPKGFQSCAMMTHDVETGDGQEFCPTLLELERAQGIKSAFSFVPEVRYKISERVFEAIRQAGGEICVHGLCHDGRLFKSEDEFRWRAKAINRYAESWGAKGFRSPVMYRNLDWYDALNFSFDMSVPNVAHLDPQRGGCCTIFPFFVGRIVELPLTTTQDYSLYNILRSDPMTMWTKQVEAITARHGLASFIIHPDYVMAPERQRDYSNLLRFLRTYGDSQNMWLALPSEVDTWWRERNNMTLVQENGGWSVAGKGCEQAVVAFARLEKDTVSFSLSGLGAKTAVH